MKRQDITKIVVVSVFAAIFAMVLSTVLLSSKQKKISVPVVEKISPDFPDVKNDPTYKVIFNSSALDPTQTITIGGGQNGNPFSGSQ